MIPILSFPVNRKANYVLRGNMKHPMMSSWWLNSQQSQNTNANTSSWRCKPHIYCSDWSSDWSREKRSQRLQLGWTINVALLSLMSVGGPWNGAPHGNAPTKAYQGLRRSRASDKSCEIPKPDGVHSSRQTTVV